MPHQLLSLRSLRRLPLRSFDPSQITASNLHKHVSIKPESKYDVLPHQQLFRRRGVSQILNKEQQFKPKPERRASSEPTASLMNFLPKMKRQGFDIRNTRTDKVCISLKIRRCHYIKLAIKAMYVLSGCNF